MTNERAQSGPIRESTADSPDANPLVGYCTNVHPGRTLVEVREQLQRIALEVKRRVRPEGPMGIGLWLARSACADLLRGTELDRFADWLAEQGLVPFTFNGFPYDHFHQRVVKHQVYRPTWADPERLAYTLELAQIQQRLLVGRGDVTRATLSTLPLGWPGDETDTSFLKRCGEQLIRAAEALDAIGQQSGCQVMLCLEPEPGCLLARSVEVSRFFERYLFSAKAASVGRLRETLAVCHDICHAAVMFESQAEALSTYRRSGIQVGKIQVSSAVEADFTASGEPAQRDSILEALSRFNESRYLHQTGVLDRSGRFRLDEDLSIALRNLRQSGQELADQRCRVHFHVPIFCDRIGPLGTTQGEIAKCLDAVRPSGQTSPVTRPVHYELETYAWDVLPDELASSLAEGLTREFRWFDERIQ